jgi:hypothetical protein
MHTIRWGSTNYILLPPRGVRIPEKPGITSFIFECQQQNSLYTRDFPSLETLSFLNIVTCIQTCNTSPTNGQTWIQSNDKDWDKFISKTLLRQRCKFLLLKHPSILRSFKNPGRLKHISTYKLFSHLIHDKGMSNIQAENTIASLDIPNNLKKQIFKIRYFKINPNKFKVSRNKEVKRYRLIL